MGKREATIGNWTSWQESDKMKLKIVFQGEIWGCNRWLIAIEHADGRDCYVRGHLLVRLVAKGCWSLVEWIGSSVGCVRSLNSEEYAETGGRNIGTWAALTLSSAGCGHGPDVDEDTITDKSYTLWRRRTSAIVKLLLKGGEARRRRRVRKLENEIKIVVGY